MYSVKNILYSTQNIVLDLGFSSIKKIKNVVAKLFCNLTFGAGSVSMLIHSLDMRCLIRTVEPPLTSELRELLISYLFHWYRDDSSEWRATPSIALPFKKELMPELKKLQHSSVSCVSFSDDQGVIISVLKKSNIAKLIRLLEDPKNITSKYYRNCQQYADLFGHSYYFNIVKTCAQMEIEPDQKPIGDYLALHTPKEPDRVSFLNKAVGLDLVLEPPSEVYRIEVEEKIRNVVGKDMTLHWFEPRSGYPKFFAADLGFRHHAQWVINQYPIEGTVYFVDTGHSIPVGALLLSLGIPTRFYIDPNFLSGPHWLALTNMITNFAHEIETSNPHQTSSFGFLIDIHRGEKEDYIKLNRGYPPKEEGLHNHLPTIEELHSKKIQRMIVMLERSPQSQATLETMGDSKSKEFSEYFHRVNQAGIELIFKGIDCRKDRSEIYN